MTKIKIIKHGLQTTVQDSGRSGYQQYGMPVSGAMDTYSLKLANILVGNKPNEACLEATSIGPEIEFDIDTFIAICGANMQARINGNEVEMYRTISVKSGDKLSFKGLKSGFRTYISFAGGIDVPIIMGSKSTYLRGKIGGFKGRQLKSGDELKIGNISSNVDIKEASKDQIPIYNDYLTARIIAGPEANYFTMDALEKFLYTDYQLSSQSDRMGYRLMGEKLIHKSSADIISSGIALGTIQVPAHGQPIIMMADRQTTGGYPRIANVISSDLPYLAQLKPGDTIRFQEIKLEKASELIDQEIKLLYSL